MPEQGQRRAPEQPPAEKRSGDQHALEELRHLIVAPEQEGLQEIRERLDNMERRAEDVSSVVAEAIQMRRDQGDDAALAEALAPTIQETLRESVRRDPQVLADALFPVMGPAIRKSISETLRSMLESFNQALEHSLSVQGLRWRIEAFRTGKSFAEIVMMHSLLYRVEQVFLIHRETGLVLNHLVAPTTATQDADLVAGMLSAIQQFARDSFHAGQEESLAQMDFQELEIWLEASPDAVLATAIRGHAPSEYRLAMKEALEKIQQQYSSALAHFQGDTGPFRGASEQLNSLLEARFRQKAESQRRPRAAIAAGIVVFAIIAGWIGYSSYLLWEWSRFLKALRQQSGIVILSQEKIGGRFHVRALVDPLAADPAKILSEAGFDPAKTDLELVPYYSVEDAIVEKRAHSILHPPPGVKLKQKDGVLSAEGVASPKWIAMFRERAPWIAGVRSVHTSRLENSELVEINRLQKDLEAVVLTSPLGRPELESGQGAALTRAEEDVRGILLHAEQVPGTLTINLVGHTDSTGVETANLPLSRQRAENIFVILRRSGIKSASLHAQGVATSEPVRTEDTEEGRRYNRSVTFKVAFSPAAPVD
jgi:OOP family OmpA-OmpF porin